MRTTHLCWRLFMYTLKHSCIQFTTAGCYHSIQFNEMGFQLRTSHWEIPQFRLLSTFYLINLRIGSSFWYASLQTLPLTFSTFTSLALFGNTTLFNQQHPLTYIFNSIKFTYVHLLIHSYTQHHHHKPPKSELPQDSHFELLCLSPRRRASQRWWVSAQMFSVKFQHKKYLPSFFCAGISLYWENFTYTSHFRSTVQINPILRSSCRFSPCSWETFLQSLAL